jgi:CDP-glycerol glycerophosphotransferase (TagB/SpsB family)
MDQSNDTVIERVRVREVAGIFRSRDALDATVDALLESGFDRADIAVSSRYAAREKLGIDIPAEVIPEVPVVPRRPFFGPANCCSGSASQWCAIWRGSVSTYMTTSTPIWSGAARRR